MPPSPAARRTEAPWPIFLAFLRLGFTAFGGPIAHLEYFRREFVERRGWLAAQAYGDLVALCQFLPGPLFTFAAFLGAAAHLGAGGWLGASVALVGIFLPGFLLIAGALPLWNALRGRPALRSALAGINAAVVGLLLAAFYDPVWTAAIHTPRDFALALAALLLLQIGKAPPWAVVLGGAAIMGLLG
jgi:chromate transporter